MRHIIRMSAIEIPIRELHARTGHYVRKAARQRIVITERGKRVAELHPFGGEKRANNGEGWTGRLKDPEFAAVADQPVGGTDSAAMIAEERDR
jgi:prevent-host-death family protein